MNPERSQGRGWVRIPASRAEQPAAPPPYGGRPARPDPPPYGGRPAMTDQPGYGSRSGRTDQPAIYLSLVKRWREAGRTLPGHPDEEWERLISQPCWPGP